MRIENILYEKWRSTPENERGEMLQQLFPLVKSHAQAVVVTNFRQEVPELEADIVSDVI